MWEDFESTLHTQTSLKSIARSFLTNQTKSTEDLRDESWLEENLKCQALSQTSLSVCFFCLVLVCMFPTKIVVESNLPTLTVILVS